MSKIEIDREKLESIVNHFDEFVAEVEDEVYNLQEAIDRRILSLQLITGEIKSARIAIAEIDKILKD